jgi:hypothetical protein
MQRGGHFAELARGQFMAGEPAKQASVASNQSSVIIG